MKMAKTLGMLIAVMLFTSSLCAEVIDATPSGFRLRYTKTLAAPSEKVFKSFVSVEQWWPREHTYSKDSANLHLDARAGGCWCEKLPHGGGVQHMTVVYVVPNQRIVLLGGLGPLQTLAVSASMTVELTPKAAETELVVEYNVGGYMQGGLTPLAAGVDAVLGENLSRLQRLIETGNPEAKPPGK